MFKGFNRLLIFGICLIAAGISLFIYSLITYSEVNNLYDKINFDDLENNKQISTSDKYYEHLSIADFLYQKLERNRNLPVKNISCIYLDYAHHNATSLYKLVYNSSNNVVARRVATEENIQKLYDLTGYYAGCKQTFQYKTELNKILEDIKKYTDMQEFSDIEPLIQIPQDENNENNLENNSLQNKGEIILQDSYFGETDEEKHIPLPDKSFEKPNYEVSGSFQ